MRAFLIFLGVVVVLVTLGTCLTRVQPGERAVVRRFGAILDEKPGPGLFVGLPWGMDQVSLIKVSEVREVSIGKNEEAADDLVGGQLLTGDHNLVNVQATLHFHVVENQVEEFFVNGYRAESIIARAAESALAEWAAGRGIDDILLRGRAQLPFWLIGEVQQRIEPYKLGVQIESASVKLEPPIEVKDYFDAVGQEHARNETLRNGAEQEADRLLSLAQEEKYAIQRKTAAYTREQQLGAQADAETFNNRMEKYRLLKANNPEYLASLWLDDMTRLFQLMRQSGRLDLLDNHLSGDGVNITQFPLMPSKKQ